jgi:hypothetical protein
VNDLTETNWFARPSRRLRDLVGRDRQLAIAMFVLLVVPFVVAVVRSYHDHWIPSGDEANIATRALDVFSRHPPLTGLPSTSGLYGDLISTNHPGPMEFYLLAIPLRLLGMTWGPLLTAAAINAAGVLIAAWVFFRRLGLNAMLWAGVLLLAVMFSGGTAVLVDTLSSNMTMYSLLCTAVLVWAVIDGDFRLLPLTAFVASYAAQQHLANALLVFVLVAVMLIAIVVQLAAARRKHVSAPRGTLRPWLLVSTAIFAVCWSPVLVQQFTGHPGNLTAIVRFARDNTRPTLGFSAGLHQVVHAIAPNGVLTRTDTTGNFFIFSAGALRTVLAIAVVVVLGAILVRQRRRSPALARLAGVALVLLVAGAVNGSNVPRSFESSRVNLYRWTWTAALLTWAAIGIAVAPLLRRALERAPSARTWRVVAPALLVVSALIAGSVVVVNDKDDHNREVKEFAIERRLDRAVLSHINRNAPVLVTEVGTDATLSLAPQLIFRLVQAGVRVEVPQSDADTIYGKQRSYHWTKKIQTIQVSSELARTPTGPGALLLWEPYGPGRTAEFNDLVARRTKLLDELASEVKGKEIVLAPGAIERIDRAYPALEALALTRALGRMQTDPVAALASPTVQKLLRQGVVQSPTLDQGKLLQLALIPPYSRRGTYGNDQVDVHLLDAFYSAYCNKVTCFPLSS